MLLLLFEIELFVGRPPRNDFFAVDGDTAMVLELVAISTMINKAVLQIKIILEFTTIAVLNCGSWRRCVDYYGIMS